MDVTINGVGVEEDDIVEEGPLSRLILYKAEQISSISKSNISIEFL